MQLHLPLLDLNRVEVTDGDFTIFQFPQEIRQIIYTTNAVESLHKRLRKVTKNRGAFPNKEAAFKLLYLALGNAARAA